MNNFEVNEARDALYAFAAAVMYVGPIVLGLYIFGPDLLSATGRGLVWVRDRKARNARIAAAREARHG